VIRASSVVRWAIVCAASPGASGCHSVPAVPNGNGVGSCSAFVTFTIFQPDDSLLSGTPWRFTVPTIDILHPHLGFPVAGTVRYAHRHPRESPVLRFHLSGKRRLGVFLLDLQQLSLHLAGELRAASNRVHEPNCRHPLRRRHYFRGLPSQQPRAVEPGKWKPAFPSRPAIYEDNLDCRSLETFCMPAPTKGQTSHAPRIATFSQNRGSSFGDHSCSLLEITALHQGEQSS
jgi:hypothetical protein